jgi:cytochrome P450
MLARNHAACRFDNLAELHYCEMVIKEALRLFPSVPLIARVLDEGPCIPSCQPDCVERYGGG